MTGLEIWFASVAGAVVLATTIHAWTLYRTMNHDIMTTMKSKTICVCSSCFVRTDHHEATCDGMVLTSECCNEALYEIPEMIERFYRAELDRIMRGRIIYELDAIERYRLRFIEDALAEYIEPGHRPTPPIPTRHEQIRLSGQRDALPE